MFFEIQHIKEKLYIKPDCRKYYPDAVIQKLNIIRNSAKEGEKRSETRLSYLLLLFEIQSYYHKNERNQPYIKPDYRKYFPDAVVQKHDILRNSAYEEENLCIKPDCCKYCQDAVI